MTRVRVHLRRVFREHDERGFTLIEAAVALALTTVVFGAALWAFIAGAQAVGVTSAQDRAGTLANESLEQAKSYGCGLELIDESFWATLNSVCRFGAGTGPNGSVTFSRTVEGVTYSVAVADTWLPATSSYTCTSLRAMAGPTVLSRSATVTYTPNNTARTLRTETVEAVPGDAARFRSSLRRHLVIDAGSPGANVTLYVAQTGLSYSNRELTRTADAQGCAWFPFLPYTSLTATTRYQYKIGAGAYTAPTAAMWGPALASG